VGFWFIATTFNPACSLSFHPPRHFNQKIVITGHLPEGRHLVSRFRYFGVGLGRAKQELPAKMLAQRLWRVNLTLEERTILRQEPEAKPYGFVSRRTLTTLNAKVEVTAKWDGSRYSKMENARIVAGNVYGLVEKHSITQ
jgi:hypothetical protein